MIPQLIIDSCFLHLAFACILAYASTKRAQRDLNANVNFVMIYLSSHSVGSDNFIGITCRTKMIL